MNTLTAIGFILVAGILGARLMTRLLPVPAITSYVLTGLLIGPAGLNLLNTGALSSLAPLIDLTLGLVVFELGRRIDYKWLVKEKWLLITGIGMSVGIFFALFFVLTSLDVNHLVASMAAAIGMASSPAVALNIVHELKAEGQVSERMLNIIAISNSLAFIVFTMSLSALHLEYRSDWRILVFHPLFLVLGSGLLGWVAGRLVIYISEWLGREHQGQRIILFALIAATVGAASMFKLSALIALLVFGITSRHRDRGYAIVEPDFSQFSGLLYAILFVSAGAQLELAHLREYWLVVVCFIGIRLAVSLTFGALLAPMNGLSVRKGSLLGLSLLPMSGVAIVLVKNATGLYPEFGALLSALLLSVLAVLEIAGPICTRFALILSGEAKN
ncbi:MAG: cation:proton antiporter [Pseudomonadota bacterium]